MSILWYPTPKQSPLLGVAGLGGGIASRLGGKAPNPYRGLVGNGSLRSGFTNLQMAFPFTDSKNGLDLSGNNRNLSNWSTNTPVEYAVTGVDKNGDPPPYTTSYGKTQSGPDYGWKNLSSDFNFQGSKTYTMECWFQVNSPDTGILMISMRSNESEGQVLTASTSYGIKSLAWSGSEDYTLSGGTIVVGQWHHGAYTRDSSTSPDTHTLFLDGTQVAQITSDTYGDAYDYNQYGFATFGGGGVAYYPNSFMQDLRVFDTVKYTSDFDIAEYLPTLDA
tara:strand:+ start:292 stop:1122 length:831 start_codon:yes stop_codon:yes gene_type:complete